MIILLKQLLVKLAALALLYFGAWFALPFVGDAKLPQLTHDVERQIDFVVRF